MGTNSSVVPYDPSPLDADEPRVEAQANASRIAPVSLSLAPLTEITRATSGLPHSSTADLMNRGGLTRGSRRGTRPR